MGYRSAPGARPASTLPYVRSRPRLVELGWGLVLAGVGLVLLLELALVAPGPWYAWLIAFGLLALGLFMTYGVLRLPTAVALRLDASARRMQVQQRWLGLTLSRRRVSLADVASIHVERDRRQWLTHPRGHRGDPVGRIVLRYHDGRETQVTRQMMPGSDVHHRAADVLRREVGLATQEDAPTEELRRLLDEAAARPLPNHYRVNMVAVLVVGVLGVLWLVLWG